MNGCFVLSYEYGKVIPYINYITVLTNLKYTDTCSGKLLEKIFGNVVAIRVLKIYSLVGNIKMI